MKMFVLKQKLLNNYEMHSEKIIQYVNQHNNPQIKSFNKNIKLAP